MKNRSTHNHSPFTHSERDVTKPTLHRLKCESCHAINNQSKIWKHEKNRKIKIRIDALKKSHPFLDGNGDVHDNATKL